MIYTVINLIHWLSVLGGPKMEGALTLIKGNSSLYIMLIVSSSFLPIFPESQ